MKLYYYNIDLCKGSFNNCMFIVHAFLFSTLCNTETGLVNIHVLVITRLKPHTGLDKQSQEFL